MHHPDTPNDAQADPDVRASRATARAAELEEYWRRCRLEHLIGPVISVALHLILFATVFVLFIEPRETRLPTVEYRPVTLVPLPTFGERPPSPGALPDPRPSVQPPVPPAPRPPDADSGGPESALAPALPPDENGPITLPGTQVAAHRSPLLLPYYRGRTDPALRQRRLRDLNAPPSTETALLRALRWYKANQRPDGSWSRERPVAMTGLGLLAFLGYGVTPDSAEFGPTVLRAVQYLTARFAESDGIVEQEYSHGIATYALAEASGMLRLPAVKPAMERGLATILGGQRDAGGWDYGFRNGERWDLSVSGWQIQALKAGLVAGAETPGLLEGAEKALAFLRREAFRDGGFRYSNGAAPSAGMTGVGTLCLQLFGDDAAPEVRAGTGFIQARGGVAWRGTVPAFAPYAWYYQTYVMLFAGHGPWKRWNETFAGELVRNQKADGRWEVSGEREYDPHMNTGFACLMLEAYYRLLGTSGEDLRHAHRPRNTLEVPASL